MVDVYILDTREISTFNCNVYVMNLFLDFIIVFCLFVLYCICVLLPVELSPDLTRGQVSLHAFIKLNYIKFILVRNNYTFKRITKRKTSEIFINRT